MLIQNDFINHWKTRLLINRLGREAALVALLSLWAYCEKRRAWELRLSPLELAGLCDFAGDPKVLHDSLVEFRFLDPTIDPSWVRVHDWGQTNSSLVAKWKASHAKTHQWHPRGYLTPHGDPSIANSIALAIAAPIDPSIDQPIGLDRIGLDFIPPVAPQRGQSAQPVDEPARQPALTPNPVEDESSSGKKRKGGRVALEWPVGWDGERRAVMLEWLAYKAEKGQGYKPRGFLSLLRQLEGLALPQLRATVEHSMGANYSGLFPERETSKGRAPSPFDGGKRGVVGGSKERTWTQLKNEADQAQADELDALPRLPIADEEPEWPWREVAEQLYGHVWDDWAQVPEDNRREMAAEVEVTV